VDANANPADVLDRLQIDKRPRYALFITGGASKMTDHDKAPHSPDI
jgi:hypothetical protein